MLYHSGDATASRVLSHDQGMVMKSPDKGLWAALASLALSLPLRYRLFLAIGCLFVAIFLAAGLVFKLTGGAGLAAAALAMSVAGLGVIILAGVCVILRGVIFSSSE